MTQELGDVNPYAPPDSPSDLPPPLGKEGNFEDALAGRYDFKTGDVLGEAWQLTKGFKASFWAAAIIIYAAIFLVFAVMALLAVRKQPMVTQTLFNGILGALFMPLIMGLMMMAVRRAAGLPVTFSTAFAYFSRTKTAVLAGLLTMVLTNLGFLLLIVPGLYLSVAYGLTSALIGDRPELSPWRAMEASRIAITHRWFKVAGVYGLVGALVMLSALPAGIGLIWTAPWAVLVLGVLYRQMFGVKTRTALPA